MYFISFHYNVTLTNSFLFIKFLSLSLTISFKSSIIVSIVAMKYEIKVRFSVSYRYMASLN